MTKFVRSLFLLGIVLGAAGCAGKGQVKEDAALTAPAGVEAQQANVSAKAEPDVATPDPKVEGSGSPGMGGDVTKEDQSAEVGLPDLKTIYFDFDSWLLRPEMRQRLSENYTWLFENSSKKVRIVGHTDERGSDAYNLALGEKRAKSVRDYLVRLGLPGDRFLITSYGEEQCAVDGSDEETWRMNRRVEFKILQ